MYVREVDDSKNDVKNSSSGTFQKDHWAHSDFSIFGNDVMRTKGCLLCSNSSDLLNVALRTTISFFFEEKRERGIGSKSPRWRGELEKLLALHAHKQPKESLEQLNFSFTSKFYLSASSFQVSELFCYALFSCSILYLFCCVPFSKLFTFYIAICCIFLSLFFIISVKKATINSSTRISAHNTLSFFTFANDVCFCLFESFAFFFPCN